MSTTATSATPEVNGVVAANPVRHLEAIPSSGRQ
jgi:hypothetical protein